MGSTLRPRWNRRSEKKNKGTKYPDKLKSQVVTDYPDAKGSFETLTYKYSLKNHFQVWDWIFKYNNGKKNF
jgi:hypothetical protein